MTKDSYNFECEWYYNIFILFMFKVPTAAPKLIEPTPVNSSALLVRWVPPPASGVNGILLGYQVKL